jgi:hypothetical protein
LFETFAVVSTLGCVIIFVVLFQANRAGQDDRNRGN